MPESRYLYHIAFDIVFGCLKDGKTILLCSGLPGCVTSVREPQRELATCRVKLQCGHVNQTCIVSLDYMRSCPKAN